MKFSFIVLPFIGIVACFVFFYVAFDRTMKGNSDFSVTVCNGQSNTIDKCQDERLYAIKNTCDLKSFLEDYHDKIAVKEHDRFRAELGTWLSIFGALAILATIMVSSFVYLSQQASLDKVEKQVERNIREINDEVKKFKEDVETVKTHAKAVEKRIKDYEKRADEISTDFDAKTEGNELANSALSGDDCVPSKTETDFSHRLSSMQSATGKFCRVFPKTGDPRNPEVKFRDKCDLGISVLCDYNSLLGQFKGKEETTAIINKMNTINIYLGIRSVISSGFEKVFNGAMKKNKPLEIAPEEIKSRGVDSKPLGFYEKLWNRQDDNRT